MPKFKYSPQLPYFQILVPTTDTTRYAFLLKTCLEVGGACPRGVGGAGGVSE